MNVFLLKTKEGGKKKYVKIKEFETLIFLIKN